MRARLILPLVAVALAACGGSSTGITPPATQTITVTNAGFVPETLLVVSNTKVIWQATDGPHVIRFTGTVPNGSNPNSSTFGAGQSVNTIFLQLGTYPYEDSLHTANKGAVTVHN